MPIEISGIDEDIALVEREVEGVVRDMARQTGDAIVGFSPVLTGFFVTNWNDSIGGPDTSVRGTRPNVSTRQFGDPTFTVQNTWSAQDGDIVFANNVDYADVLDAGGSPQAPQGVTDPVASIIDSRFRRVEV